jgi:conjugal transfer pilin signal peptidase TrbI
MRCNYKLPTSVLFLGLMLLCGVVFLSNSVAYNPTISEPIGWYWLGSINDVKVGELYTVKLSYKYMSVLKKLGYNANSGTLLKRVIAMEGDNIEVILGGILLNGKLVANSCATSKSRGISLNPLPIGFKHKLITGEYFLLGETRNSFDSRYFGLVSRTNLINHAQLIIKE